MPDRVPITTPVKNGICAADTDLKSGMRYIAPARVSIPMNRQALANFQNPRYGNSVAISTQLRHVYEPIDHALCSLFNVFHAASGQDPPNRSEYEPPVSFGRLVPNFAEDQARIWQSPS